MTDEMARDRAARVDAVTTAGVVSGPVEPVTAPLLGPGTSGWCRCSVSSPRSRSSPVSSDSENVWKGPLTE